MARKYYIEQNENIPAIVYEENAPDGFIELTDNDMLSIEIKKTYELRRKDGISYCDNYRANLMMLYSSGQLSESEALHICSKIAQTQNELRNGDWIEARESCENIVLDLIFTMSMKQDMLDYINSYILGMY